MADEIRIDRDLLTCLDCGDERDRDDLTFHEEGCDRCNGHAAESLLFEMVERKQNYRRVTAAEQAGNGRGGDL